MRRLSEPRPARPTTDITADATGLAQTFATFNSPPRDVEDLSRSALGDGRTKLKSMHGMGQNEIKVH